MASSYSHENALQGHMVNLSQGAETQSDRNFQALQVHTCLYRSRRPDGSINQLSGRGFVSLTPGAKIALCLIDQNPSFRDGRVVASWGSCAGG